MAGPPAISVAMCTFNGAAFLPEQLRSIASQTLRPAEIVIFDDGSMDRTVEILEQFSHGARGFDVRVVVNPVRVGPAANFGQAIGACRGDVIALSDQDDVWLPDKL